MKNQTQLNEIACSKCQYGNSQIKLSARYYHSHESDRWMFSSKLLHITANEGNLPNSNAMLAA